MLINHLKEYMFANDLTAADVAHEINASPGHIRKLLCGKSNLTPRFEWKIRHFISATRKVNNHTITKKDK